MDKAAPSRRLTSSFADDPAYAELIEMFVHALPERVRAIESALRSADPQALRVLAHQLKGAAPGYGYESIGRAAARVEEGINDATDTALKQAIGDARELIELCRSASAAGGTDGA